MLAVILSAKKQIYSTSRLAQEFKERGHEVMVCNPKRCILDVSTNKPVIHYSKKKITSNVDMGIPRIGAASSAFGIAGVRQFEMANIPVLNPADAIARCRDKFLSFQLLCQKGLPLPKTVFASSTLQTKKLIQLVGGDAVVIKLIEGSQGKGVFLGETFKASESLIDAFRELNANFLVQEYIEESAGTDLRCIVLNGEVIAGMKRIAKEGDFRANIHRGGEAVEADLTDEEKSIAIEATKCMGLNFSGVDLIRSHSGPRILEINSSPGLEGIEGCTKKNIAGQVVDFMLSQAKK